MTDEDRDEARASSTDAPWLRALSALRRDPAGRWPHRSHDATSDALAFVENAACTPVAVPFKHVLEIMRDSADEAAWPTTSTHWPLAASLRALAKILRGWADDPRSAHRVDVTAFVFGNQPGRHGLGTVSFTCRQTKEDVALLVTRTSTQDPQETSFMISFSPEQATWALLRILLDAEGVGHRWECVVAEDPSRAAAHAIVGDGRPPVVTIDDCDCDLQHTSGRPRTKLPNIWWAQA